jgi:hypothetical protein
VFAGTGVTRKGEGSRNKMIKLYPKGEKHSVLTFSYLNLFGKDEKFFVELHFKESEDDICIVKGLSLELFKIILNNILK